MRKQSYRIPFCREASMVDVDLSEPLSFVSAKIFLSEWIVTTPSWPGPTLSFDAVWLADKSRSLVTLFVEM
jgi:hypothetical protein